MYLDIFIIGRFSSNYTSVGGCGPAFHGVSNNAVILNNLYFDYTNHPPYSFGNSNKYGGRPWIVGRLIQHEIGHALGLLHSFSNRAYSIHGDTYWPHNRNCNPDVDTYCTNNVMNYPLGNHLSNNQLGHMHKLLTNGWRKKLTPNCNAEVNDIHTINSNVVWDMPQLINHIIKIKNGGVLTISCYSQFSPGSKIIIEKGGKLIVDGGVLTSSCENSFWDGIEVQGDNSLSQVNQSDQGVLILKNNALIEYARQTTMLDNDTWGAGGIIQATNSTFKDCKRAVAFYSYPFNNKSFFKRCKFKITSDYLPLYNLEPNGPLNQVTLWDNKGVRFLGCEFVDNSGINQFNNYSRSGISSIDAGFSVVADCNILTTPPCPPQNETRSSFKNFNHGVQVFGASTNNTITVDQTDFIDNSIAFQANTMDNVRFTRNTIKVGGLLKNNYTEPYLYGAQFKASSGFEIEENSFSKNGSAMPINGLKIINAGEVANEVYRNDFKELKIGEKYDGINKHRSNAFIGLQFLCNTNSISNEYDIEVAYSEGNNTEGVRTYQGSVNPDESAGNIFSANPIHPDGHIRNLTQQPIIYQYNGGTDEPTNYTPSFVIPNLVSNANTCPSRFWPMTTEPGYYEMPEYVVDDYYSNLNQYNDLLYTYHQNIDNGNTDSLIDAVGLYFPNEAQLMRDNLMSIAPNVSEVALMDAAMTGILTDALLLEVCLANPDATRDEAFLDFVEFEIPNPLPASMVQLIYQNWNEETPRTIIEKQLAGLNSKVGRLYKQILHHYKSDSLSQLDSIESMYQSIKTLQSKYRLVEMAITQDEFAEATQLLQSIESNNELNGSQQGEHDNMIDYVNFRESLIASNVNILQLEKSQLNTLRNIADLNTGRASVMAQNILCFGYQECAGTNPNYRKKKRSRIYIDDPLSTFEKESIAVSIAPNPANKKINVSIEGGAVESNFKLEIHSIDGKLVFEKQLNTNTSIINISNLVDGIYLYSVYSNNGSKIKSDKLIIQH